MKIKYVHSRKLIWKFPLKNGSHFVWAAAILKILTSVQFFSSLQKMKQTKGRTLKLLEVKKELQLSSAPKCGRKEPLCASERLPIEKLLASSSETSSGEISEFSEPESPPDQPATKPASFSLPFKPISSQTEGGLDYMNQFKKKGGKQSSTTRAPAKKAGTKRKRKTKRKAPRKKAATEKAKAKNNKAVVHIR